MIKSRIKITTLPKPLLELPGGAPMLTPKARTMSYTDEYLRSDNAAQQLEIPKLVNCTGQEAILQGMRTLWQNGLQRALQARPHWKKPSAGWRRT